MIKITQNTQLQILFIFLLFCSTIVFAQVGIGNNNPQSVLDISSSNQTNPANTDGILIPRIDNFPAANPGATQDGMLVFVTGSGTPTRGFYYWEQSTTSWMPFGGGSSNDWALTGNAGTTAGTNFIGTTDAVDVAFKHANVEKARITSDETFFVNEITVRDGGTTSGNFLVRADDNNNNNDGRLRIYRNNAVNISLSGEGESVFNEVGDAASDLRIESDNQANMFFVDASTDRIGIGLNNPAYNLEMKMNGGANYLAAYENTNVNGGSLLGYNNVGNFNALGGVTNIATGLGSYGVSLQATGASVGVFGTSNSSDANGVEGSVPTTGTWLGFGGLFSGGLGYVNGIYNLSDERVKSNIEHIDNALYKLSKINGIRYNYNLEKYNYLAGGDQKTYLGFSAQNIKSIFPEAVTEKYLNVSGPETKTANANMSDYKKEVFNVVDYTALIPVTVEAIKEQQQIIESQNDKIKLLEKKLSDLEAKVNSLLEN
ncbi:MAG: tail fiber domain-containing protein [Flavobacteriaceae bacterium]